MSLADFKEQMIFRGWYSFPDFIGYNLVQRMLEDLGKAYEYCRKVQLRNDVANSEGTCHHLLGLGSSFIDCLAEYERLDEYFTEYFQGKYILNSFGGNILSKGMSYANDIHRDIRSFSSFIPLMMNTLIMLDDFTSENGATWLMDRGHELQNKPSDKEFDDHRFQITGKAGTVVVWNSNLWHKAGENTTNKPRRSVTPELTKPFMKQGFDYPRALGQEYGNTYSPYLRQVLGYNSRTPATLQEWYQPESKRMYRSDQG